MPDAFPAWVIPVVFGLMGACIGSFLNVVIYRMPRGVSVNDPARSFCPECGKPIPWFLNIPVLSWLALRGKSACCGTRISFRYCFVELLTALLFAAIGWKYADASTGAAVLLCLWTAMAIVIMFIDAEHLIVFRSQAFIGALAGTGACALYPFLLPDSHVMTWTDAFTASVLGGAAGYAVIRLVIELGKLLFGTWKQHFDVPAPWSLREPESEREELQLIVNGQPHDWSMLFHRSTDKAVLSGGSVTIDGKTHPACSVTLRYDRIEMENGGRFSSGKTGKRGGKSDGYPCQQGSHGIRRRLDSDDGRMRVRLAGRPVQPFPRLPAGDCTGCRLTHGVRQKPPLWPRSSQRRSDLAAGRQPVVAGLHPLYFRRIIFSAMTRAARTRTRLRIPSLISFIFNGFTLLYPGRKQVS